MHGFTIRPMNAASTITTKHSTQQTTLNIYYSNGEYTGHKKDNSRHEYTVQCSQHNCYTSHSLVPCLIFLDSYRSAMVTSCSRCSSSSLRGEEIVLIQTLGASFNPVTSGLATNTIIVLLCVTSLHIVQGGCIGAGVS